MVARLDNAGDVLLLAPALRALRAAAPRSRITLLASPAGTEAAGLLPWVSDVITADVPWQDARAELPFDPAREAAFIERLRAGRYDAAFICTSFSQSPDPLGYACYLAGIPIRVGHRQAFSGSVLSHPVEPPPEGTHQVDRTLALLEAVGIPVGDVDLEVAIPENASEGAAKRLAAAGVEAGAPYIVLAPGASAASRRYDGARFGEVARGLNDRTGWPAVVIGAERDRPIADEITGLAPETHSLVGSTSLAEAAALVAGARLVITVNSATMHLADALRVPEVVLFAGTERESEWRPRRTAAVLLRQQTPCAPCRRFECPIHNACLELAPEVVVDAALALAFPPAASPTRLLATVRAVIRSPSPITTDVPWPAFAS